MIFQPMLNYAIFKTEKATRISFRLMNEKTNFMTVFLGLHNCDFSSGKQFGLQLNAHRTLPARTECYSNREHFQPYYIRCHLCSISIVCFALIIIHKVFLYCSVRTLKIGNNIIIQLKCCRRVYAQFLSYTRSKFNPLEYQIICSIVCLFFVLCDILKHHSQPANRNAVQNIWLVYFSRIFFSFLLFRYRHQLSVLQNKMARIFGFGPKKLSIYST